MGRYYKILLTSTSKPKQQKKYYGVPKYVTVFVNAKAIKGKTMTIDQDAISLKSRSKENITCDAFFFVVYGDTQLAHFSHCRANM